MKPIGDVFHIFSDVGQRLLWYPLGLAERHRNHATERTLRSIPQDQVRNAPYNKPGIIKAVYDRFVYYTVAEKIQDANRRAALSVHTMVFPLEELIEDGGALLPPHDKEEYQALGLPSELHSHGRRLADIQEAIDRWAAGADVPTRQVSAGWNTRELNWLLGNPVSIISDSTDGFSAETAISGLLSGLPALASAGLGFAAGYIPNTGRFHVAARSGNAAPISARGVSAFRSGPSFQASVESAPTEQIMKSEHERGYRTALIVVGGDPLDILGAFGNGLRDEKTGETILADLIAQALSDDDRSQGTLVALERSVSVIEGFPQIDREIICSALDPLADRSRPRGRQAESLISALRPAVPGTPPASRKVQTESPLQEAGREDTENVQAALEESIKTIKGARGTDVGVVSNGVRRFAELVIAGGPGVPQGEKLADLVQELWREIVRWGKRGGKEDGHRDRIRRAFGYREDPAAPSVFDDLIHITRQAGSGKEQDKALKDYNKLIDTLVAGQRRGFLS